MVDCHWRLSPLMAREVLRATASANLFWLEDALDESGFLDADLQGLRSAANAIGTRIAGGEKITTLAGMRDLLARGGADVVLPDLRVTGIRPGMAMLDLAAASGVEVSIHNPVGPVLDAVSLQVAAALPSFLILEGQVGESPLFDEIARRPAAARRWPASRARQAGHRPLAAAGLRNRRRPAQARRQLRRDGWRGTGRLTMKQRLIQVDLSGLTAFVTGGSRGIAAALVEALAAIGADVAFSYAAAADEAAGKPDAAEALCRTIAAAGGRAQAFQSDLTQPGAAEPAAREAERRLGRVDILVLSASVQVHKPFATMPAADVARQLQINLTANIETLQALLRACASGASAGSSPSAACRRARPPPKCRSTR